MKDQVGTKSEARAANLSFIIRGQKQAATLVNDLMVEAQIASCLVNDVTTK